MSMYPNIWQIAQIIKLTSQNKSNGPKYNHWQKILFTETILIGNHNRSLNVNRTTTTLYLFNTWVKWIFWSCHLLLLIDALNACSLCFFAISLFAAFDILRSSFINFQWFCLLCFILKEPIEFKRFFSLQVLEHELKKTFTVCDCNGWMTAQSVPWSSRWPSRTLEIFAQAIFWSSWKKFGRPKIKQCNYLKQLWLIYINRRLTRKPRSRFYFRRIVITVHNWPYSKLSVWGWTSYIVNLLLGQSHQGLKPEKRDNHRKVFYPRPQQRN